MSLKQFEQPLVTIVVPVYNMEPYLSDLFQSLFQQSFQNFSVIVIDDGSTDGSAKLIQDWVKHDERFTVFSQSNQGLSATRNRALDFLAQQSTVTTYILFVDADDKLDPKALELLTQKAERENLDDLVFTSDVFFTSDQVQASHSSYLDYYERNGEYPEVYSGLDFITLVVAADDFKPSACMQLFRTQFILENDIRFYDGIIHEDNLFTFQCLLNAKHVAYLDEKLYIRRIREDSIVTRALSWKNVDGYFRCGVEAARSIQELGMSTSKEHADALSFLIACFFESSLNVYMQISEDERRLLDNRYTDNDSTYEQTWFETAIKRPAAKIHATRIEAENEFAQSLSYRLGRLLTFPARMIFRNK